MHSRQDFQNVRRPDLMQVLFALEARNASEGPGG